MRTAKGGRRLALCCGLPEDAFFCGTRVTWVTRGSVLVEGQHGLVEMTPERIRLRTDDGVLSVIGEKMTLRELSADAAMISAKCIETLTYACRKGEDACV